MSKETQLKSMEQAILRLESKHDQTSELLQKSFSALFEIMGLSEDEELLEAIRPQKKITPSISAPDFFEKKNEKGETVYVLAKKWLNVMEKLQVHRMNKYYDQPEEKRDPKYKEFYKGMLNSHEKWGSITAGQFTWVKKSLQKEAFIIDPMLGEKGTSFGDNA